MKQKVNLLVERASDGGFWCYPEADFDGWSFSGFGETAKEAIDDAIAGYRDVCDMRASQGIETPQLDFAFRYDVQSFFNYFPFLNISRVGEIAGINPSLMRQYASGSAKAGQKQYEKIRQAVRHISQELAEATF